MNEFLTGLSSGPPWLWGLFVLGVMAAAALSLTAFWGALFRAAALVTAGSRRRPPALPPGSGQGAKDSPGRGD